MRKRAIRSPAEETYFLVFGLYLATNLRFSRSHNGSTIDASIQSQGQTASALMGWKDSFCACYLAKHVGTVNRGRWTNFLNGYLCSQISLVADKLWNVDSVAAFDVPRTRSRSNQRKLLHQSCARPCPIGRCYSLTMSWGTWMMLLSMSRQCSPRLIIFLAATLMHHVLV